MTNSSLHFPTLASRIIKEQELVIGPLAWYEAKKVQGLIVLNEERGEVNVEHENPKNVIDALVIRYERIFGHASHDVCREAVQDLIAKIPPEEIPSSLK